MGFKEVEESMVRELMKVEYNFLPNNKAVVRLNLYLEVHHKQATDHDDLLETMPEHLMTVLRSHDCSGRNIVERGALTIRKSGTKLWIKTLVRGF